MCTRQSEASPPSRAGLAGSRPVKDFMKIYQIEKSDQCQQPAKWTQLFHAGLMNGGSIDFSGFGAIFTKPFTNAAL